MKKVPYNTQPPADLSNFVFGKVQPQALPLEEAVLGAAMLDKNAFAVISDILQPDSFYLEANQHIYRAMRRLYDQMRPIDLLTVMQALQQDGTLEDTGGPAYLAELTNRVASAANIEYHARIIEQKAVRRRLIAAANEITRAAFDETEDEFNALDEAEKLIFGVSRNLSAGNGADMGALSSEFQERFDMLLSRKDGLIGIDTGYPDLNYFFGGWQAPDLIIVAARPGMGKTGFALGTAYRTAKAGNPVAFFSLEMSKAQLYARLVSLETGIGTTRVGNPVELGQYERQNVLHAAGALSDLPIVVSDSCYTLQEIRAAARRAVRDGAKLIIVDYLQLIQAAGNGRGTRENEVSEMSRALKLLAKELNVPIIALSQLSRAVETRGGTKRPQLSDLRESGSIEQDADIVKFIYRPEYYGINEDESGNSVKGKAEIIVAKHRNGPTGSVWMGFHGPTVNFTGLGLYRDEIAARGLVTSPAMRPPAGDDDFPF